jgi:8-oxo-dGTP diphosphatase
MKREFPERPIVGVGVVVWRGDEVLLIQRGKAPRQGQWSLPGGAQETGETVIDAGRREVLEETGVTIGPLRLVDVVDSIQPTEDGRVRYHFTLIDFTAEWQVGDARPGVDEMATAWVRLADLAAYGLWAETVRIVLKAAEIRANGGKNAQM